MTRAEFDVMMAEALTRIGMNVPSLRSRYAALGSWEANAIRNHSLIATRGPTSIAIDLEKVIESDEDTGTLLPSYLKSVAVNLRRMREFGDDGDRPLRMPKAIPEETICSMSPILTAMGAPSAGPNIWKGSARKGSERPWPSMAETFVSTSSEIILIP